MSPWWKFFANVFFRHFIFCENITSKILKGDISTSKFKIIEMSKSVDELCRELLIDEYSQTNNRLSTLSPKEHRICTYFKMNYTDNKIAQSLNITKTTLSCHRRNILSKLNLKNKQQLYMFCKTLWFQGCAPVREGAKSGTHIDHRPH